MKITLSSLLEIPLLDIIVEYPQGMYSERAQITHHYGSIVVAHTYMILPNEDDLIFEASL
jgi:hypothetical protein